MHSKKWRRFWEYLRTGNREELLDRGRQELAKRADVALSLLGYDLARRAYASGHGAPGKFFFAPESVDSILGLLRQRIPGRAEQIVQEAEEIRSQRFRLLGYSNLDFGHPIDWHFDAVHGKSAPKKPFYRLHYLRFDECGDTKVIWELNRHQHFVTLAKAYRLTGDRCYLDELLRQQGHWREENPYPIGINWASSLEVAFRALSWIWALNLVSESPEVPDLRSEWLPQLALHGRHIERYLSTYFSPNTHLLGEALALFFLGVLLPELSAAARWKSLGWEILTREAARQVCADGFYFEQSTYYHVYALDFFLHAAVLASVNSIPVPEEFWQTIRKMSNALFLLSRDGPPPQFGDDDGGRLFDPRRNQSEHMVDPLSTAAVLFQRGDFKRAVHDLREETLWLLGEQGVRQWDALKETEISRESGALQEAGYYVLSTPTTQLVADAGPLGSGSGGHGHADALSVCLQIQGRPVLIDPGTSEYVGPGADRALFRGTSMHNTLRVEGLDQAEIGTVFSWRGFPQANVERWIQAPSYEVLVASHDGYRRLEGPVTHRRSIVSLKNGAYLIRDVVSGTGRHRLNLAWHLGQDVRLIGELIFRVNGTPYNLSFLPAEQPGWTSELDMQMCSPVYGRKAHMSVLKFQANLDLPAEFAVMLVASEDASTNRGSLQWIEHAESAVSEYRFRSDILEYSFMFNEYGEAWRCGSVASDAKYVCHRRGPETSDELLFFCDGTYAGVDELSISCSRRVDWGELNLHRGVQTMSASENSALLAEITPDVRSLAVTQ
jgi:hypothetical protein